MDFKAAKSGTETWSEKKNVYIHICRRHLAYFSNNNKRLACMEMSPIIDASSVWFPNNGNYKKNASRMKINRDIQPEPKERESHRIIKISNSRNNNNKNKILIKVNVSHVCVLYMAVYYILSCFYWRHLNYSRFKCVRIFYIYVPKHRLFGRQSDRTHNHAVGCIICVCVFWVIFFVKTYPFDG